MRACCHRSSTETRYAARCSAGCPAQQSPRRPPWAAVRRRYHRAPSLQPAYLPGVVNRLYLVSPGMSMKSDRPASAARVSLMRVVIRLCIAWPNVSVAVRVVQVVVRRGVGSVEDRSDACNASAAGFSDPSKICTKLISFEQRIRKYLIILMNNPCAQVRCEITASRLHYIYELPLHY